MGPDDASSRRRNISGRCKDRRPVRQHVMLLGTRFSCGPCWHHPDVHPGGDLNGPIAFEHWHQKQLPHRTWPDGRDSERKWGDGCVGRSIVSNLINEEAILRGLSTHNWTRLGESLCQCSYLKRVGGVAVVRNGANGTALTYAERRGTGNQIGSTGMNGGGYDTGCRRCFVWPNTRLVSETRGERTWQQRDRTDC